MAKKEAAPTADGQPAGKSKLKLIILIVVGLLLAALYHPVWTSAIHAPADLALALAAFAALVWARVPPWLVVPLCGAAGWLLG